MRAMFLDVLTAAAAALALSASASHAAERKAPAKPVQCDETIKAVFRPEDQTTVLLVEKVKKGQAFANPTMEQLVYPKVPTTYGADLCHVKLLVGPGNPGPANAPSTSRGIAIEIWLPEKAAWNQRFHAVGGSGSTGSEEGLPDRISSWTGTIDTRSAPRVAAEEGAVTATTDSGKGNDRSSSFLMNPDGTPNNRAIRDWTSRALVEQAVKTKVLIKAYYGAAPRYSYFDGASGGGWQGHKVAQTLPQHYDGILSGVPVMNWNEMIANAYPAIVIRRDLGGKPMSKAQLDLVSQAAIGACDVVDGKHLGFIIDNAACRYDPVKDKAVLCAVDGGTNRTQACLTRRQALAVNKMWYGMTLDGSVPDPAVDNGLNPFPAGRQIWYGQPRGTDLVPYAQLDGMALGTDMIAIATGDARYGGKDFRNATGNGAMAWQAMSYEELAAAFAHAGAVLRGVSANDPDLSALKDHGGKWISVISVNDNPVLSPGALNYYAKVMERMGGAAAVQSFYRMFLVPGMGHGPSNGTANPDAWPPVQAKGQMYKALTDWVEKGIAPQALVFSSTALDGVERPAANDRILASTIKQEVKGTNLSSAALTASGMIGKTLPVCAYPTMVTHVGGDIFKAESYTCR